MPVRPVRHSNLLVAAITAVAAALIACVGPTPTPSAPVSPAAAVGSTTTTASAGEAAPSVATGAPAEAAVGVTAPAPPPADDPAGESVVRATTPGDDGVNREPATVPDSVAATGETLGARPGSPASAGPASALTPSVDVPAVDEAATSGEAGTRGAEPADTASGRADGKRVVALDPGHGGPESGAVNATANGGRELIEKNVNLAIALKLRDFLTTAGYAVVLTRDTDRAVHPANNGSGYRGGLVEDLQTRVDIANAAGADLFLSIHHNGSENRGVSGAEVWYNNARPFSERNVAFAEVVLDHLLAGVRAAGYPLVDRGIKDDANFRIWQGRAYNIFVLGPGGGARPHAATQMPGALVEGAFVSHDGDARMLAREEMQSVIARAYADAVDAYFARFPE